MVAILCVRRPRAALKFVISHHKGICKLFVWQVPAPTVSLIPLALFSRYPEAEGAAIAQKRALSGRRRPARTPPNRMGGRSRGWYLRFLGARSAAARAGPRAALRPSAVPPPGPGR